MSWIRITPIGNIPLREGRCVTLAGKELAIFRLHDRVYAVDNQCPHSGGPLCDGITSGTTVVCPLHGWRVSLESGEVERPSQNISVNTYDARVRDGVVEINWRAA